GRRGGRRRGNGWSGFGRFYFRGSGFAREQPERVVIRAHALEIERRSPAPRKGGLEGVLRLELLTVGADGLGGLHIQTIGAIGFVASAAVPHGLPVEMLDAVAVGHEKLPHQI